MSSGPLDIIITGASGRMGRLLTNLVLDDDQYKLAGATEIAENLDKISALPCKVSANLEEAAKHAPASVIIDFTAPAASLEHAVTAHKLGLPLVMGTTGFTSGQKAELEKFSRDSLLFWSANMSVGLNVLLAILPVLAKSLGPDYDMEIMEAHHKHKKDAPSGTAVMLAEALAKSRDWNLDDARVCCRNGITGERKAREIGIQALRGGDVVGIHSVWFLGPGEIIKVDHQAESRENFARGALRAARWLPAQKPGKLYSMVDLLGLASL